MLNYLTYYNFNKSNSILQSPLPKITAKISCDFLCTPFGSGTPYSRASRGLCRHCLQYVGQAKMGQMGHYKRVFTVFYLMENETNETV